MGHRILRLCAAVLVAATFPGRPGFRRERIRRRACVAPAAADESDPGRVSSAV
jgi:hypothetical protein